MIFKRKYIYNLIYFLIFFSFMLMTKKDNDKKPMDEVFNFFIDTTVVNKIILENKK